MIHRSVGCLYTAPQVVCRAAGDVAGCFALMDPHTSKKVADRQVAGWQWSSLHEDL